MALRELQQRMFDFDGLLDELHKTMFLFQTRIQITDFLFLHRIE